MADRRSYGTGSLYTRSDNAGRESWYGKWRMNRRQVKRKLGPKRAPGSKHGLTCSQAESALRRMMGDVVVTAAPIDQLTVEELGAAYIAYSEKRGRKRSIIAAVESAVRVWLAPFFEGRSLDSIKPEDITDLIATMEADGLSAKSICNYIGILGAMLSYAGRRRWVGSNETRHLELPNVERSTEIRFLTEAQVDALIDAVRPGDYAAVDAVLFETAALTGLRVGELVALRWMDVDWTAQRVGVRRNHVMGEFDTPKSRRSTRSVPMAHRLGIALERFSRVSAWSGDGDLVFADPLTGEPLSKWSILRRFRKALAAAGLDTTHRYHDLRHTFGSQTAAAGVPMRTLQEWMGHRDIQTTQRYADYAPSGKEVEFIEAAFGGAIRGTDLSESDVTPR